MRILVVEDEKEIRNYLVNSLRSECYAVDAAKDGEEGSYMARTNKYDVIILDNIMPKKTGLEVCEEIRKEGNTTPILILSVRTETTTKVELLNAGADDYLTKPFSLNELLARLNALQRRPRNIKKDIYGIDDLVLDPTGHTVRRGDNDIYLTRKEFALLMYLMQNQGIVMSRAMLLEHVWDMNIDPFSNTIESHIMSLRRKIDLPQKPKLIHNVPGRGYKLELKEKKNKK